jgi:hypothetical protein
MNWIPLLATALFTPVLTGVVVYLLQLRWQEQMEKRLTRFSKLHERRAEVIAELYKRLVQIQSGLALAARLFEAKKTWKTTIDTGASIARTAESIRGFWDYFQEHRIYLPEGLGDEIERFYQKALSASRSLRQVDVFHEYTSNDEHSEEDLTEFYRAYTEGEWAELSSILAEEIPPIKDKIERRFRELLGS